MPTPFEQMSALDRLVHEPARLAILTALSACRTADFIYLQALTAVSKGNLSNHLQKLSEGGLVAIEKGYRGRVPQTTISLTAEGRAAIVEHWRQLEALRAEAQQWNPASAAGTE
jgi:DNA-binding MarR family transcriptional regulator